ncbi:type I-B CRISPR-associated protein Cas7/Cst2/DevR [Nocardiopsis ansamitocini]|uniref:Type I-B CRISPR-associated protein Cas7/Cst2/DevR n=1 Tax=Nocardiopsis ansamitocini TaxID=1670832 RepID=A0A9W6P371_9ACTN|nr:type I-B CRISPR-associated protein Cas7/Cst2/DevR [Nocardiopsis ansamitocini]GLU46288.1 type I-B CRISPR-associated protein Cas7/Cst2/DevR [Nocardiopsis ansamitocini]
MTYLVGKIALDITAGAPNNGRGEDNVAVTKKLWINKKAYPYVSAQAFRRWLRDSLPASESRSPVTRSGSGTKQQAHTAGRPDLHLDDDLFGYMVAVKKENYQRDTVLATGTLVSVLPAGVTKDFGTMSRGFPADANPVIHEHEHYTAQVAGDVLLDLARVGVFEQEGGGLRRALSPAAAVEALAAGAQELEFRGVGSLRLDIQERRRRAALVLRTMAEVRGGAKQSLHYGDRAPSLVLLAPLKGGNNPFTRVLAAQNGDVVFDTETFKEEKAAWEDELDGPILIGWAPGFLGDQREKARKELKTELDEGQVVIDHPRVVLQGLAKRVEAGEHDAWFEDAAR